MLRILQARFGEIDDRLASRVRASDSAILDRMLERALTATRPDDVLDAADPA